MRSIIRTSLNRVVAGVRQNRLVAVDTVNVRGNHLMRMRVLYQHALQALAGFLATAERRFKPAPVLAPSAAKASLRSHLAVSAPRCWQPKAAGQRPSRQS